MDNQLLKLFLVYIDQIKNYYLKNYFIWINTLEKIKSNKFEDINLNNDDILYLKLNINSELIKKPFELIEKDIELESSNTESKTFFPPDF